MANLTKCAICNNTYSYCPNCSNTHAWKFFTDTHECYQIFITLKEYKKGLISKAEAKKRLEYLGITFESNLDKYKSKVAEKIKEILTEPPSPVEEKTSLRKTRKSKLYKE